MFRCFYLKDMLQPSVSIYYSRDFMLAVDYWKKHGTKLEPELIAKSDIAVANSTYLANYCKQYNPNSFYIGQGCDLGLFDQPEATIIPTDIQTIKKPIVGYVGALQSIRLNMLIIEHIATQKPDWQIVFFPLFVLQLLILSASVGLWLALVSVQFRDIGNLVPFLLTLGFFLTPVGYTASRIPQEWQLVYALNPLVGVIEGLEEPRCIKMLYHGDLIKGSGVLRLEPSGSGSRVTTISMCKRGVGSWRC